MAIDFRLRNAMVSANQAMISFKNAKAQRDTLKQKEEQLETDKKIKELQLKKLEGQVNPEVLELEKSKLKNQVQAGQLQLQEQAIKNQNLIKESQKTLKDQLSILAEANKQGFQAETEIGGIKFKTRQDKPYTRMQAINLAKDIAQSKMSTKDIVMKKEPTAQEIQQSLPEAIEVLKGEKPIEETETKDKDFQFLF